MSRILEALRQRARSMSQRIAVEDGVSSLTYWHLWCCVDDLAQQLNRVLHRNRAVAIFADNGAAWAIADLSLLFVGVPIVPLPLFFSSMQITHALRSSGAGYVLTDQPERLWRALQIAPRKVDIFNVGLFGVDLADFAEGAPGLCAGTAKVTFTSGTTGEPKGVCLGLDDLERTAESLCSASVATISDRHLCMLPLATLLENVGGVYAPILAGAMMCAPRMSKIGLSGSSGLNVELFTGALRGWQPTSAIMVPQMLQALVGAIRAGAQVPRSLRYLAVGGAPISKNTLVAAQELGLPVYEGYGLSECGSVVAVNHPGAEHMGSVGRPLPHLRVSISNDGEVLVDGMTWRGYVGEATTKLPGHIVATGDLGYIDSAGFLHITGRRKNIFITSFGRNVAPEWVERELTSHPSILQAALFGEGRPFNTVIIVPHPSATERSIETALKEANRQLPDYAQAHTWIRARAPFSAENGMATANGRLRRAAIYSDYINLIDSLYHRQIA